MQGKIGAVLTVMVVTRHIHHTALLFLFCLLKRIKPDQIRPGFHNKGKSNPQEMPLVGKNAQS
jgi:hypothetical protein